MSMTPADRAGLLVIQQAVHVSGHVHVCRVLVTDLNLLIQFTFTPSAFYCTPFTRMSSKRTGTWYICTYSISSHVPPFHSLSCWGSYVNTDFF